MVLLDIAEEVLLRLSVKDLVRCKSVCKLWYSLISSPAFIKTHVKFITNKNKKQLGNIRIAVTRRYVIRKGDTCTIPREWESYDSLRIQGSSNGLVCMSSIDNNRVCLINPYTREFRKLQKPPIIHTEYRMTLYAQRYGFGYDSSTDDYKLVMAMNQGCDGTLIQILSLKSNIWKTFGHVNYSFHDSMPGTLFNGALHWFWYNGSNDNCKRFIMCFDLAKEEFREIPQPEDMRYEATYSSTLRDFRRQPMHMS